MYAVIKTGGKQYRVAEGDVVNIEKIEGDTGANVAFEEVLMVSEDAGTKIGTPFLDGASVSGTILEQGRSKKLIVFKFKRRKDYKRKYGHRQSFTRIRIDQIQA